MCAVRILILSDVGSSFGVVQFNIRPSLTFELNLVSRFAILPVYKPHDNIGLPINTLQWNISYLFRVLKFFSETNNRPTYSRGSNPDFRKLENSVWFHVLSQIVFIRQQFVLFFYSTFNDHLVHISYVSAWMATTPRRRTAWDICFGYCFLRELNIDLEITNLNASKTSTL